MGSEMCIRDRLRMINPDFETPTNKLLKNNALLISVKDEID